MAKSQTNQGTQMSKGLYNNVQNQLQPTLSNAQTLQSGANQFASGVGQSSASGLESIASSPTGGYDPTQFASITGGYSQMANTGGFTDQQQADYINAATSGVTSTYDNLMQQQQQQRAAQGMGAGGGEYEAMAENLTAAQDQADLNARSNLATQINQNKLSGLGGLTGVEQNVVGNQLAANQGLNQLYNTATGEVTAQGLQVLQSLGLQFSTQEQASQIMAQLSQNPGFLQTLLGDVSQLGGAAAGVMTGVGALNKTPTGTRV